MPKYAIQASYTPEQWARVVGAPLARGVALRRALDAVDGCVHSMYFLFGEHNLLAVVSAPDPEAMAAVSVAMASTGVFSSFTTQELIDADDLPAVLERARKAGLVTDPVDVPEQLRRDG